MLNKEKYNWHGFRHEVVAKMEGSPQYIGTFCVRGEYSPCAVYSVANPNREKGHKDFLIFSKDFMLLNVFYRGMDAAEMEQYRKQSAVECAECNETIYSVMQ